MDEERAKRIEQLLRENNKHQSEINNNLKFFFWLTIISMVATVLVVANEMSRM